MGGEELSDDEARAQSEREEVFGLEPGKVVTQEQYDEARKQRDAAEQVINAFHTQKGEAFKGRWKAFEARTRFFTEDELRYSQSVLCPCGHGLAYPKNCPPFHQWDCSAILKGIEDTAVKHTDSLPFAFYEIKSEEQGGGKQTTRGVFKPKPS